MTNKMPCAIFNIIQSSFQIICVYVGEPVVAPQGEPLIESDSLFIVIVARDMHPSKAPLPIVVTLLGMVTI